MEEKEVKKGSSVLKIAVASIFGFLIFMCLGFMKINADIKREKELERISAEGNKFAQEQMEKQKRAEEEIKKYNNK